MIYFDSCALLKFIKPEQESAALRSWRAALPSSAELATSELARLEITRTLLRGRVDYQRVPYLVDQAVQGVYVLDLTSTVVTRATAYRVPNLGSLDAIHLASAEPFRADLDHFVTYDKQLTQAAADLGFPVSAPS